jgi:hypothetical protein
MPVDVPDYCNDLNAMHEAEKLLTPRKRTFSELFREIRYHKILGEIVRREDEFSWRTYHATAAQRAEAFVLTMEPEE